jgi:polysaccharide deacetylase 2 family uncharacterized protein YibQ
VPFSRSRARSRYRTVVLLLSLMAVGLAVVLVSCPRVRSSTTPTGAPVTAQPSPAADIAHGQTAEDATAGAEPERGETLAQGPVAEPVHPAVRGQLALIIDDAGYDLAELQPFLDLPMPLAIAVLPNLPNSAEAARRVRESGKDLLLHLPMEPEGPEDPGPGALLTTHTAAELERLLDTALATVPGAVGVNNHMGSKATADRAFMDVLLEALDHRGLLFVDSRTTPFTVAAAEAERLGVPSIERKVFLDAVDGGIEKSLEAAIDAAASAGAAVAIGHVQTDGLADILRRAESGMERSGVRPAKISSLVARREVRVSE